MNRIDRLSAIVTQLQSRKIVTAQQIADRFEISLRTVYRDIRALEEAGIPIGAEAGKGYFIMDGYHLPPVSFTKDEAGAILMAAKLAEKNTDKSIQEHFMNALFKIKSVLKVQEKDYLENLEQHIQVLQAPNQNKSDFPDHFLADLQSALATRRVIAFEYYSNYKGQLTTREVEPLGLCFYSSHWHMIGYCRMRKDLRDFRTDRITRLKIIEENYDPGKHQSYQSYLDNFMHGTDLKQVTVKFHSSVVRYIGEQKYYLGWTDEKVVEDGLEMRFMTSSFKGFSHWLLMFGPQATVLYPQELIEEVQEYAHQTYLHYSKQEASIGH